MKYVRSNGVEVRYDEDRSPEVLEFLSEVAKLCEKYRVSISHEDSQGAFIIERGPNVEGDSEWLSAAAEYVIPKEVLR